MSLDMASATYGRDKSGQKNLLATLKADIEKIRKSLSNENYDAIINNVNKYWSGADAQKFLTNFKKSVSDISAKMKTYENTIEMALNADANQFAKMQSLNATTIKKI